MPKPFVSYITFNRLGLTVKSLSSILSSSDDFELHIVDSNSTDGTWEYLQSLKDSRIKSRTQLPVNAGQIYALNNNLMRRQPDQYFFTIDNDVVIETKDWISRFMKIFQAYPKVGLLGVLEPTLENLSLQSTHDKYVRNYVPKGCLALRPGLIEEIGYWSEENYFGNLELLFRVERFTSYEAGVVSDIVISMPQSIQCTQCQYQNKCQLDRSRETCFSIYQKLNKNDIFEEKFRWKFDETVKDMSSGARPVYCATLQDEEAISNHIINTTWAVENFQFFIDNAN